jgi:hypothetical protein
MRAAVIKDAAMLPRVMPTEDIAMPIPHSRIHGTASMQQSPCWRMGFQRPRKIPILPDRLVVHGLSPETLSNSCPWPWRLAGVMA